VVGGDHGDVALLEERDAHGAVGGQHGGGDEGVEVASAQLLLGVVHVQCPDGERHPGCTLAGRRQQAGQQRGLAEVGHGHGETARHGLRVEGVGLADGAVDLGERAAQRVVQAVRAGGGGQSAAGAPEELVAEVPAQLAQAVAHGGLGDVQRLRGGGDAAGLVQQHEDPGEVEIEAPHIDRLYSGGFEHLLVRMSQGCLACCATRGRAVPHVERNRLCPPFVASPTSSCSVRG